jgi:hypothetical protein
VRMLLLVLASMDESMDKWDVIDRVHTIFRFSLSV